MQNWPTEYCADLWWGQHFCLFSEEYTSIIQATSMVGLAVIIAVAGILIFRKTVYRNKAKT
jgi:hypothetical protein